MVRIFKFIKFLLWSSSGWRKVLISLIIYKFCSWFEGEVSSCCDRFNQKWQVFWNSIISPGASIPSWLREPPFIPRINIPWDLSPGWYFCSQIISSFKKLRKVNISIIVGNETKFFGEIHFNILRLFDAGIKFLIQSQKVQHSAFVFQEKFT